MKTCKKCTRQFSIEDFGPQAYCRECWRTYNRNRMRISRPKLRAARRINHADEDRRQKLLYVIRTCPNSPHVEEWRKELESL